MVSWCKNLNQKQIESNPSLCQRGELATLLLTLAYMHSVKTPEKYGGPIYFCPMADIRQTFHLSAKPFTRVKLFFQVSQGTCEPNIATYIETQFMVNICVWKSGKMYLSCLLLPYWSPRVNEFLSDWWWSLVLLSFHARQTGWDKIPSCLIWLLWDMALLSYSNWSRRLVALYWKKLYYNSVIIGNESHGQDDSLIS